jgi:ADP-heptose:LPS heptosyltransferase
MKRLIFRLSSLGDLVLSQSSLEAPFAGEIDWVVAREFSALVEGNPRLRKVWKFDRKANGSLGAWSKLIRELAREDYSEVVDLHSTLRTKIARLLFAIHSPRTRWRSLSKERGRRLGYSVFKALWPAALRPGHLSRRAAVLAGGTGTETPNLKWLIAAGSRMGTSEPLAGGFGFAIAPSSAWATKEWPAERYLPAVERIRQSHPGAVPVLLGTSGDRAALTVKRQLEAARVPFVDGIGKWSLPETAAVLASCRVAMGPDTGLMHLAEAVGTPVVSIFGPTRADYGFGPLDPRSRAVEGAVGCAPCSKDGRICYRFGDRFACLRRIDAGDVVSAVDAAWSARRPSGE